METTENYQEHGSFEVNHEQEQQEQQHEGLQESQKVISFPGEDFPKTDLTTKYWWAGKKETLPKRIYNQAVAEGEKEPLCLDSGLARQARMVQYMETYSLLYKRYGDQLAGRPLMRTAQRECLQEIMDYLAKDGVEGVTEAFIEGYGGGYLPVREMFDRKDEAGEPLPCIRKAHVEKAMEICAAQATYRFFEKHFADLYVDGKAGVELLQEAEESLNEVCEGLVPRRLKKQVRENKARKEAGE